MDASTDVRASGAGSSTQRLWPFLLVGIVFGVVLVKSEVVSWFRIQEMFRFQSFHMYGVIASAISVAAIGRRLLGLSRVAESPSTRHWLGGTAFGLGWGLTGACPGPTYALIGGGYSAYVVVLVAALVGAWTYGRFRPSLPH